LPGKKLAPAILCLLLIFGSLPAFEKAKADNGKLTITVESLNVREGPGLSYPIAGSVKKNEKYSILKEEGDWIQISLGGSRNGWVAEWFTTIDADSQPAASPKTKSSSGTVTTNGLRVRKGPGTNFEVIGSLKSGQAVEILNSNDKWAEVRTNAIKGWAAKEFIENNSGKVQSSKASGTKKGTITADSLNVREIPSLDARTIGRLTKGAEVTILSQTNGWTEITYNAKNAWVSSQYIKTISTGKPSLPANEYTGTVTASQLYVRERNALDGKILGSVTKGQSFKILEEQNNWVKIEYKSGKLGWAAGWFFQKEKSGQTVETNKPLKNSTVKILHNGTNIRKGPSTGTAVISRVNHGNSYKVISVKNDWYEISLHNGTAGYVAGWLVSVQGDAPQIEKPGAEMHTKNKTVVIDPGHGGRDNGTTGVRGTLEKTLTMQTAQLLYDKLKASGTNAILTRNNDSYLSLASRVSTAHYHNADAFISIHFDSINDRSVRGMTTYYYSSNQKPLGEHIHSAVISKTMLKDRGARFGDYHVLRENRQNGVLLELGYLSNPAEEMLVNSSQYQQTVANGIFEGLARYFKTN
jgi:N-acetylmuramoyl-L-alanine amidase